MVCISAGSIFANVPRTFSLHGLSPRFLSSQGNLYYALTHSPEPLSEEEAFTLSWEAATKRLEAAGSIAVEEAEAMAKALKSNEAGIEVGPFCVDSLCKGSSRSRYSSSLFASNIRSPFRHFSRRTGKRLQMDSNDHGTATDSLGLGCHKN